MVRTVLHRTRSAVFSESGSGDWHLSCWDRLRVHELSGVARNEWNVVRLLERVAFLGVRDVSNDGENGIGVRLE